MSRTTILTAALLVLVAALPAGVSAERSVLTMVQAGEIRSLEEILRIVRPQVAGSFISADFDYETKIYRLRFMNNGNVVNVDVDARTGQRLAGRHY